jgi:hypothetical protein
LKMSKMLRNIALDVGPARPAVKHPFTARLPVNPATGSMPGSFRYRPSHQEPCAAGGEKPARNGEAAR